MRFLKFLFIQIVILVTLLFLVEGIGRLVFRAGHGYSFKDSLLYDSDDDLVYKINPSYKGKEVIYSGFRGLPFAAEKPPQTIRIVAFGGSTTWGGSTYRDSWPYQLELLLNLNANTAENLRYEVINAGISGYGSAQHYARLKKEILGLDPDFVIIFSGWNLVGALDNSVFFWVPDNIVKPGSGLPERLSAFLTDNSVIFAKLRALFPRTLDMFDLNTEQLAGLETEFVMLAEKHKDYLKKIVRFCRENEITPIIIKYPHIFREETDKDELDYLRKNFPDMLKRKDYLVRHYERVMDKIDEVKLEEDCYVIDCSGCFERFPGREKAEFFRDNMHLKDKGYPIEAKAIYEEFIRLGKNMEPGDVVFSGKDKNP